MEIDLRNGQNETVSKRLCALNGLKDRESRGFEILFDGKTIQFFVVRINDTVFGYTNECPHIGTPLNWKNTTFLTQDGSKIICATHGALFRIDDGACTAGPCLGQKLNRIELDCIDGEIIAVGLADAVQF